MNALKRFWTSHVQKTIASLLGLLAFVDLTGYGDAITAVVGAKGYAFIRVVGAVAIAWRAFQAHQPPLPAPDPNASRG